MLFSTKSGPTERRGVRPGIVVLCLTAAVLLSACSGDAGAQPGLQPVVGDGFKVSLPGEAKRVERVLPSAAGSQNLVMYQSTQKTTSYSVSYSDFAAGSSVSLDGSVDGAAKAVNATVSDRSSSTLDGHEARDAVLTGIESNGKAGTGFLTVVLVGNRLYSIFTVVEGAQVAVSDTRHGEVRATFDTP